MYDILLIFTKNVHPRKWCIMLNLSIFLLLSKKHTKVRVLQILSCDRVGNELKLQQLSHAVLKCWSLNYNRGGRGEVSTAVTR